MSNPNRVLITGAASGIGNACVRLFNDQGYIVLGMDLNSPDDDSLFAGFEQGDVTDGSAIDHVINAFEIPANGLDALVHCAGMTGHGSATDIDPAFWSKILNVNLTSTFLITRAVIPHMQLNGGGSIVTIGSTFSMVARDRMIGYAVSKAGVAHLTRCLAIDYAKDNIRANCVCPGLIDTPMTSHLNAPGREDVRQTLINAHPMKRPGTAEEVANAIAFLSSDAASYITGQVIGIDGGFTAGKQVVPEARE